MEQSKRTTYIIAAISFIVIVAAVYFLFIFKGTSAGIKPSQIDDEVVQLVDIVLEDQPYVTLTPTSDGAEIVISIENMARFDRIEYELIYLSDNPQIVGQKIQRGATGTDVNTKDAKYKKSILLGTASRGVRSPDRGITDGKLTMHLFSDETEYLSETPWNLVQIGSGQSTLGDAQGNFVLEVPALGKNYWAIVADTLGLPPGEAEFELENVILPVYGVFSIAPEFPKLANLTIKLNKETSYKLYVYNNQEANWRKLASTYDVSTKTLRATVSDLATFVVTSSE